MPLCQVLIGCSLASFFVWPFLLHANPHCLLTHPHISQAPKCHVELMWRNERRRERREFSNDVWRLSFSSPSRPPPSPLHAPPPPVIAMAAVAPPPDLKRLGFVETAATNSFEFVTGTTVFSKACGYYTSAKETNALKVRPSRGHLCLLRTERGFLPAFALTRTRASSGVVTQHTVRVCCVCFREEARSLLRNTRVGPSPPLGIPSRFPRACGFPARCSF